MKIKIGILDDHVLFRQSFALLLTHLENTKVLFQYSNAHDLLQSTKLTAIDILFLDIQMPVLNGFQVAEILQETHPYLNIIVLSSFNDPHSISRILKYNVSGYLTKSCSINQLKKAIHSVFNGGVYYDSQIKRIVQYLENLEYNLGAILTNKEIEIIKLFAQQYNGREIAEKLHLSFRTIEKHKEILMQKTNSNNFIGVIIFALLNHYISENDLN